MSARLPYGAAELLRRTLAATSSTAYEKHGLLVGVYQRADISAPPLLREGLGITRVQSAKYITPTAAREHGFDRVKAIAADVLTEVDAVLNRTNIPRSSTMYLGAYWGIEPLDGVADADAIFIFIDIYPEGVEACPRI